MKARTVVGTLSVVGMVAVTGCSSSSGHSQTPGPSGSPSAPASSSASSPTQTAAVAKLGVTQVATLRGPVALAFRSGDPNPWIVEQRGTVQRLVDGKGQQVLDLTSEVSTDGSERGLLGIAFSKDGSTLYLDATIKPHGDTRVWAFSVAADGTVDTSKRTTLVEQVQPFSNHNGGQLTIGPDGMLYVGLGDGGSAYDPQRNGQKLSTLLGKILRIDPTSKAPYVPSDNPFATTKGALPQIWLYGVRNPWRFSFDKATGDLWIGDVGQDKYEEIDRLPASSGQGAGKGANLGWSAFEGAHALNADQKAPGAVTPVYEYSHDVGCSITGGFVYRGKRFPDLVGRYVYSDYCAGGVWALSADGSKSTQIVEQPKSVSSFGEAPDGELYVMSTSGGVFTLG